MDDPGSVFLRNIHDARLGRQAVKIERLEAEVERLRGALKKIAWMDTSNRLHSAVIAKKALEGE